MRSFSIVRLRRWVRGRDDVGPSDRRCRAIDVAPGAGASSLADPSSWGDRRGRRQRGFRYRPPTSHSLASSCGSVENLNVSTGAAGCSTCARSGPPKRTRFPAAQPSTAPTSATPRDAPGVAYARQPVAGDGILDGGDAKIPGSADYVHVICTRLDGRDHEPVH